MMTVQQLVDAFTAWAAAHGVVAKPENDEQWTPTPDGAKAPVQMTYISPSGSRLRLPADVMVLEADKDGTMEIYLRQVLALYGKPTGVQMTFSQFLHPPPPVTNAASGPVGAEVPRESVSIQATLGGRIDASKRYFYVANSATDGQRVTDAGKTYIAVKPSPFSVWWMLIA